ncbi:MAG: fibronectin type III domain-containing protein [Clostridiales bacterium]|nr:fibronectin type III domain-containing protein [Clostridiales bacterium]
MNQKQKRVNVVLLSLIVMLSIVGMRKDATVKAAVTSKTVPIVFHLYDGTTKNDTICIDYADNAVITSGPTYDYSSSTWYDRNGHIITLTAEYIAEQAINSVIGFGTDVIDLYELGMVETVAPTEYKDGYDLYQVTIPNSKVATVSAITPTSTSTYKEYEVDSDTTIVVPMITADEWATISATTSQIMFADKHAYYPDGAFWYDKAKKAIYYYGQNDALVYTKVDSMEDWNRKFAGKEILLHKGVYGEGSKDCSSNTILTGGVFDISTYHTFTITKEITENTYADKIAVKLPDLSETEYESLARGDEFYFISADNSEGFVMACSTSGIVVKSESNYSTLVFDNYNEYKYYRDKATYVFSAGTYRQTAIVDCSIILSDDYRFTVSGYSEKLVAEDKAEGELFTISEHKNPTKKLPSSSKPDNRGENIGTIGTGGSSGSNNGSGGSNSEVGSSSSGNQENTTPTNGTASDKNTEGKKIDDKETQKKKTVPVVNEQFFVKATASSTSIKLKWNEVKNVDGYLIYGAKVGQDYRKIADVKSTSYTIKKLKSNKYYKYLVKAYKIDRKGNKRIVAETYKVYVITCTKGKSNAKSITANVTSVSLKLNGSKSIKITVSGEKGIKHIVNTVRYITSDNSIATFKNGKIKAVGKGTCFVYAIANNGQYVKIKVNVK